MSDLMLARDSVQPAFIASVRERIARGERIHELLPGGGRLQIDRPLPFLGVHRLRSADAGSGELLLGQSSFLLAPAQHRDEIGSLVEAIVEALAEKFGAVLLLEVWARPADDAATANASGAQFRIYSEQEAGSTPVATASLQRALQAMSGLPAPPEATVEPVESAWGWRPYLDAERARQRGCRVVGLEVPSLFRAADAGPVFPTLLRALRRELGLALQKALFEFMQVQTNETVEDFRALGLRGVGEAVWQTDAKIARIAAHWNFLLGVTPVNAEAQWREFQANRFTKTPVFQTRLLPFDPDLLKRELYDIEIERVESPALQALFHEKRLELDRQITLLEDRNTPRFLPGSMALYGGIEAPLLQLAEQVLARTASSDQAPQSCVDAREFARRARQEIEFYRAQLPDLESKVEVRADVPGVMVTAGQLLVAENFTYPVAQLEALIQHEVGTHIVSYANGRAQPLQLLCLGFPDYDPLQEGTAVLAEWLCGGLHPSRLRVLAARVWAINALIGGADFIETFGALQNEHGFAARAAWDLTLRVYRGGGFTKDAVYLRGLAALLDDLKAGGEFELLWSGKIGAQTLPLVRELHLRGVLHPMKLRPRFLDAPASQVRIARLRSGLTVLELLASLD